MTKLVIAVLVVLFVLWLATRGKRRRRREDPDRRRRKAHNSRLVSYAGFDSTTDKKGRRRVHATERNGPHECSDSCKYCKAGAAYQGQLRVFDDRPIRGARDRRKMRKGE